MLRACLPDYAHVTVCPFAADGSFTLAGIPRMMTQESVLRCKLAHCLQGVQAQQSGLHWLRRCRQAGCCPQHARAACEVEA